MTAFAFEGRDRMLREARSRQLSSTLSWSVDFRTVICNSSQLVPANGLRSLEDLGGLRSLALGTHEAGRRMSHLPLALSLAFLYTVCLRALRAVEGTHRKACM